MIDRNGFNQDFEMSEEAYQQALDEIYKDVPKWEPTEADLYAMFIEFNDPELQENFKEGDDVRYARDLAEAIVYLDEHGGFENTVEQGVDKFNRYVKMYLPQKQFGSYLDTMEENLDSLNRWYERLSFEQDALKQNEEQLSFGIDLSKKIEKKDTSKELDAEKTVEISNPEKDLEVESKAVESESVSNTNRRLPKEDWIRKKHQEERLRDLEKRGMYNSFENGVSGDSEYDFDEFD